MGFMLDWQSNGIRRFQRLWTNNMKYMVAELETASSLLEVENASMRFIV